jgi:hypothetical protein
MGESYTGVLIGVIRAPSTSMNTSKPLFSLGQCVTTASIPSTFTAEEQQKCLARHLTGDWGDLEVEDKQENDRAVKTGDRILSSYKFADGRKLWIISEGEGSDRVTTLLKPEEY